ncbi:hypothetical protein [Acinetobacter sp. F9]|uniref:hypothetical protein n=1 Tax=Acinetobacter sp. F9 TaxID=2853158 RepID=UPI001C47ACD8|nr:hypothetical protein [Acinetobacter sp. F9]
MNLIEKLGLEKCKQIVDGAPEGAEYWRDMDSVCSPNEILHYRWFAGALIVHDAEKGWIKSIYHDGNEYILDQLELLSDLKSEIDHHYYGQSEEKELEQYALLSQEKIEGGAMLIGDNSKAVQMVRDITDHCSDIKNHISPNTKVIER